jgi:ATP-binding cassette subfamily B protein
MGREIMAISANRQKVKEPLRQILGDFWGSSYGTLVLVVITVIASSAASVSAPYLFSRLINQLSAGGWERTIAIGVTAYAVLIGLALALQHIVQFLSYMSAEKLGLVARTRFFKRLIRKSIHFFVEHNPAEIQATQMAGGQALAILMQVGLMTFLPGGAQLIITLAVLGGTINPLLVLMVILYGAVFVALTNFVTRSTRPDLEDAITAIQENAKFVGNAIGAMETLRYFGSAQWMSERFAESADRSFTSWRRYSMKRMGYAGVYGIALTFEFAVTFAFLIPRYQEGLLTVGDIVLFNALLLQLNQPFEMIGRAIDDVNRSYSSFLPFARMWAAPEEPTVTQHANFTPRKGTLEFNDVGFSYDNGRSIEKISFTAERGKITFIVGETGSGKSTIFKLTLNSLRPTTGEIRIDDVNLADIDRSDWYAAIGVVPQDIVLLNDTLRTNIVLGRVFSEPRLRSACSKAAILERIEEMAEGFDTVVGERGMKLSGGERQRIAIARAIYAEPKVLFLDEASSALDEATEREIMDHIRKIVDEVTVLAITHRKIAIRPTDVVIELPKRSELINKLGEQAFAG